MSKPSTQLDIKDTKLRGKSLRDIGTAAQTFELLPSPTVLLAMMSNAVAYQETSHDERLTKSHSVSTAIGKAKQQRASPTATATAPAICFYYSSITTLHSLFAFLFAIMSLPVQFHTALFRQHGSGILRAKNPVYLGLFWFGHNLSLVNPLQTTKLWFRQIYIRASGTTQLPLLYKPTGPSKPLYKFRYKQVYIRASGTNPLLLHTNPLARACYHFEQGFWFRQIQIRATGTNPLPLLQTQWPEQTTASNKTLVQANLYSRQWYNSTTTFHKPTGPSRLPLHTSPLAQTNNHSKPTIASSQTTRPDQDRPGQTRPYCSRTTFHNLHPCDMVIFLLSQDGNLASDTGRGTQFFLIWKQIGHYQTSTFIELLSSQDSRLLSKVNLTVEIPLTYSPLTHQIGNFGRITNSFSYFILDPPSNTKTSTGNFWGDQKPKKSSPINFRLISPIIENYRGITCQHTTLYSGNLTSNHKSSRQRDSSRLCVDQITYSRRHTINGDLPEMRDTKYTTAFSSFLGTNTSNSENAREQDAKLLLVSNKHRLLISRHSSEISCYHGHCAAIGSRKLHIAAQNNLLTTIFSNHLPSRNLQAS